MTMKLIIQLWQTGTHAPALAAAPFMMAASAAAMDIDVSIHALGASVELFQSTNPARHAPVEPLGRPLSAYVDDALRSGVRFAMCSTAIRDRHLNPEDMIEGATEIIGMVSMLEAAMDPGCKVLVY
jgi:predicted peroxiredoxin